MLRRSTLPWTTRSLLLAAALVVSLAPLAAQDSAAKVIYQNGQVSISSDGYFKALSVGDTIKTRQMIVTGPEGYAKFEVLSDHSTFEVLPNSKVIFRDVPGSWENLLNVWMGRVKVFIQHAPGVPNPNKVTSPTAVISVRGTVFDVVVEDDDGTTLVTVDEGVVDVRNVTAPGNSATLRQGDYIRVYRGQPLVAQGIDKGNMIRRSLQALRDVYYNVMINRPVGGGGPAGVPVPGAQGDKGKGGNAPGAPPGAPPAAPGAPPNAPGGGGN